MLYFYGIMKYKKRKDLLVILNISDHAGEKSEDLKYDLQVLYQLVRRFRKRKHHYEKIVLNPGFEMFLYIMIPSLNSYQRQIVKDLGYFTEIQSMHMSNEARKRLKYKKVNTYEGNFQQLSQEERREAYTY